MNDTSHILAKDQIHIPIFIVDTIDTKGNNPNPKTLGLNYMLQTT